MTKEQLLEMKPGQSLWRVSRLPTTQLPDGRIVPEEIRAYCEGYIVAVGENVLYADHGGRVLVLYEERLPWLFPSEQAARSVDPSTLPRYDVYA